MLAVVLFFTQVWAKGMRIVGQIRKDFWYTLLLLVWSRHKICFPNDQTIGWAFYPAELWLQRVSPGIKSRKEKIGFESKYSIATARSDLWVANRYAIYDHEDSFYLMSAPAVSHKYVFRQKKYLRQNVSNIPFSADRRNSISWCSKLFYRFTISIVGWCSAVEFAETFQPRRNQPIGRKIALDVSIVSIVTHSKRIPTFRSKRTQHTIEQQLSEAIWIHTIHFSINI